MLAKHVFITKHQGNLSAEAELVVDPREKTEYTLKDLHLENKLIITLSDKGCKYQDKIFPVKKVKIKDLSGAGDTFISGLVLEWLRTNQIDLAIKFAQECATIVVQKQGVVTI